MNQQNSNISCPQCGYQIDVNDILHHQIEANLQKKYNNELAKRDSQYQQQCQNLQQQQAQLDEQTRQQDNIIQQRLQQEKKTLQQQIKQQLKYEQTAQLEALQQELADKSTQLKEFNKAKADITRLQREKDEQKASITAEYAQRFTDRLKEETTSVRSQVKKEMQAKSSIKIDALQAELSIKSTELSEFNQAKIEIKHLKDEKEAIEAESLQRFNKRLKTEQHVLRDKITKEMKSEVSGQLDTLQQELAAKSEQLKDLNQTKADLMRLEREKEELRGEVILEKEREFSKKLIEERLKIQRQVDENTELKVKALQNQLDEQKNLAVEMKRKAEQGSMQIQGEVQELAIEEWLAENFPLDTIEEIKKGARGADCLQTVHTQRQQNCGTIYYESKRTKEFQANWIEKFKNDIREKNATLGVLVTESMPSTMSRMGLKDGIWVCSFEEFKGLSSVLRETVIKLSDAVASQVNKGDKMEMLYSYLTGNEFKLQVEGIVEGFSQMQKDLDSEKRSMARIWKQREKQLQKVLLNTTHMYGSIKGIAGSAVASVALLELGDDIAEEPTL